MSWRRKKRPHGPILEWDREPETYKFSIRDRNGWLLFGAAAKCVLVLEDWFQTARFLDGTWDTWSTSEIHAFFCISPLLPHQKCIGSYLQVTSQDGINLIRRRAYRQFHKPRVAWGWHWKCAGGATFENQMQGREYSKTDLKCSDRLRCKKRSLCSHLRHMLCSRRVTEWNRNSCKRNKQGNQSFGIFCSRADTKHTGRLVNWDREGRKKKKNVEKEGKGMVIKYDAASGVCALT